MFRTLTAAAALAAFASAFCALPAHAADAPPAKAKAKPARKAAAKKPAPEPEVVGTTDDNLDPGQLTMADRVLTGVSDCEFKQKVDIEKIEGHTGNFKLTFDKKSYIMVPQETTTGAILLRDTSGALLWVQIPVKSMLMNQKEHHRLVDNCQADEQRIAVQSASQAGANAPFLAPSAATPASAAVAAGLTVSRDPAQVSTTVDAAASATITTTTTTTTLVPPPSMPASGAKSAKK
jgi:hypothetical protein